MRKILLIDIDGKLPNLVLCKLSTWYKALGYEVCLLFFRKKAAEIFIEAKQKSFDKAESVFVSTLFTWNRGKVEELLQYFPNADVGGTGWDLNKDLPAEVEACKPDYDLYKVNDILPRIMGGIAKKQSKIEKAQTIVDAGIGFSSRGCTRQCPFCFVPGKEGEFRQVANIGDLLNPRSNVLILLDNNLTADPDVIDKLHEIRDRKLIIDISQGIDVRLLTPEIVQALSEVKHLRRIHYAWDLMSFERQICEGIRLLKTHIRANNQMCFMLTGYNTSFDEDMYRFKQLKELGVRPYVMPYNKEYPSLKHFHFTGWINGMYYTICSFEEYKPWMKAQSDPQISLF